MNLLQATRKDVAGGDEPRVFGLDVMRAVAVLLVVFGHTFGHSEIPHWLRRMSFGGLGVEVFFVLSGYLIGSILIRKNDSGRLSSASGVMDFWQRRWLRTVPLYWLFLLVYSRFDWRGALPLGQLPEYLVFAQNIFYAPGDFFIHSWSLAVEEHFYLWFPLLMLAASRWLGRQGAFHLALLSFLLLPLLLRLSQATWPDAAQWEFNQRLVVATRLDSIAFGIAAAWMQSRRPGIWQWLQARGAVLLGLALLPFVLTAMDPGWQSLGKLPQVLGFSLVSLLFASTLPFFSAWTIRRPRLDQRMVVGISKISYSLYLSHVLVFTLVNRALVEVGQFEAIYRNAWLLYPMYWSAMLLLSMLTYLAVEKPFMQLRRDGIEQSAMRRNLQHAAAAIFVGVIVGASFQMVSSALRVSRQIARAQEIGRYDQFTVLADGARVFLLQKDRVLPDTAVAKELVLQPDRHEARLQEAAFVFSWVHEKCPLLLRSSCYYRVVRELPAEATGVELHYYHRPDAEPLTPEAPLRWTVTPKP